jgi:hypothetical protein
MQRIIRNISRLVFVGMTVLLLLAVAIGEILLVQNGHEVFSTPSLASSGKMVALATSGDETLAQSDIVLSQVLEDDARPILVRKYLEKYKSPLVPYAKMIVELSDTYGFEYYWIVAIAQQESNLCKKIPENSFNCWGYGIHKRGTLRFENYELALKSYAEYLKREYFDKGLNTTELIMKKYCPSSNGSWAYGVSKFINDIENGNI